MQHARAQTVRLPFSSTSYFLSQLASQQRTWYTSGGRKKATRLLNEQTVCLYQSLNSDTLEYLKLLHCTEQVKKKVNYLVIHAVLIKAGSFGVYELKATKSR